MRRVLGGIGCVLAWLVILGAVLVLAAAVVVPRLAGATPFTVLTGSMQPELPPGTLVVVRPVDADEVRVGDVITYQLASGRSTVVTHRVVSIGTRLDGRPVFITQGDANDTPDEAAVRPVQIRGRLWYSVPLLGHVNSVIDGKQRQSAVLVVSTALVGYAAFMFVGAVRDRRRTRGLAPVPDDTEPDPQLNTAEPGAPERAPAGPDQRLVLVTALVVLSTLLLLTWRRLRR